LGLSSRPHTPTDLAWIESFFGHNQGRIAALETFTDPALLETELARVCMEYDSVRLQEAIGYVTGSDSDSSNASRTGAGC
jgi:putative transposase